MFPLPDGETVIRERRQMVLDPYSGEATQGDWSNPDQLTLEGVLIGPSSSIEPTNDSRQQVITQMSIYCGPNEDILPQDRIRAGSVVWDVGGEVADWKNGFTGWNPGAEFRITKAVG